MNKLQMFVVWLDGFMDGKNEIKQSDTYRIKKKLNGLFTQVAEHVDESDLESDSKPSLEQLGNTHGFPVNNPSGFSNIDDDTGEQMRC